LGDFRVAESRIPDRILSLYKRLSANISRLAQAAAELRPAPLIRTAAVRLGQQSQRLIEGILSVSPADV
jgi:hypothetical protein